MSESHIVVIHGATGNVGRAVVDHLLARGHPKDKIVAPVRKLDADAAKTLSQLGVRVVPGDLLDRPALVAAYAGAHSVFYVPMPGTCPEKIAPIDNAIIAAREAKISRFVLLNCPCGPSSPMVVNPSYVYNESAVVVSGLPYLIVRMGLFIENNLRAYKGAIATGVLSLPIDKETRTPFLARDDVARGVAAAILKWDAFSPQYDFDFEGTVAYNFPEIAAILSKIAGKEIVYKPVTVDEFAEHLKPFMGPMARLISNMVASFGAAAKKGEFKVTNDLFALTGRVPEPFADALARIVKQ